MEDTDDVWDFLMTPNSNLLAIHKYNTKFGEHCATCFRLNLAMQWFVEITKTYQLGQ